MHKHCVLSIVPLILKFLMLAALQIHLMRSCTCNKNYNCKPITVAHTMMTSFLLLALPLAAHSDWNH